MDVPKRACHRRIRHNLYRRARRVALALFVLIQHSHAENIYKGRESAAFPTLFRTSGRPTDTRPTRTWAGAPGDKVSVDWGVPQITGGSEGSDHGFGEAPALPQKRCTAQWKQESGGFNGGGRVQPLIDAFTFHFIPRMLVLIFRSRLDFGLVIIIRPPRHV
ncbi:hypothetical protein FB451DRAFT_1567048 [Mycena latifolia]|nr:hypothetical protein FB451DRAFT_1567048 [Mycena latifolia]